MFTKIRAIVISVVISLCLLPFNVYAGSPSLRDAFAPNTLGVASLAAGYDLSKSDPFASVSKVISLVLSLLGVVFLVLLIYGGFLWMTARGSEQQVEKSKEIIFSAVIGLIIVVAAYAISIFVVTTLTESTLKPL